MSTNFFLRTHPGYFPHNTPGGFFNTSAPAVAVMPPLCERTAHSFYSIGYIGKKRDTFFQFMFVQVYQLIFTSQCDIHFRCFLNGLLPKKVAGILLCPEFTIFLVHCS
jgi:hypothetical protein